MCESRPELFRGRHFRDEIIVLCVRWYLRYPLSYRNPEEMTVERGLTVGAASRIRRYISEAQRACLKWYAREDSNL
jgi:transposase-like protein